MDNVKNGKVNEAASILKVNPDDIKNITDLYVETVAEVAEESEVRYEFTIVIRADNDTSGFHKLESAIISFLKKHELIVNLKQNSSFVYVENKKIQEKELNRIDSILSVGNLQFADKELLYKRNAEIEMQLVNLKALDRKIFDVKLIHPFKYSAIEEKSVLSDYLLLWIEMSILVSLIIVLSIDKELRNLLF
ncbi:MAG: hypothetical protein NT150_12090 [Bacteroidetes bacterium]|nr:hypothetical protein [Bacteroidota bacterium]